MGGVAVCGAAFLCSLFSSAVHAQMSPEFNCTVSESEMRSTLPAMTADMHYTAHTVAGRFRLERTSPSAGALLDVEPMQCDEWRNLVLSIVALDIDNLVVGDAPNETSRAPEVVETLTPPAIENVPAAQELGAPITQHATASELSAPNSTSTPNSTIHRVSAVSFGAWADFVRIGNIGLGLFAQGDYQVADIHGLPIFVSTAVGAIPYSTTLRFNSTNAELVTTFARVSGCVRAHGQEIPLDICATATSQIFILQATNARHQTFNPTLDFGVSARARIETSSAFAFDLGASLEGRVVRPNFELEGATVPVTYNVPPLSLQLTFAVAWEV